MLLGQISMQMLCMFWVINPYQSVCTKPIAIAMNINQSQLHWGSDKNSLMVKVLF